MNWTRASIGVAGAAALIALFAFGMKQDPRDIGASPLKGRVAPQFTMQVMNGKDSVRLGELRGQVVVLNFWASWCLECRDEHAVLQEAAALYQPQGVKFYGVLYNDSPENGNGYLSEMGGQAYPTLLDPKTRVAIDYGVYGVPETFFIAPDGHIASKKVGPITPAEIDSNLRQLVAQAQTGSKRP